MGRTGVPDSDVERYRRRAADLRAMARTSEIQTVREELEVMARQYEQLADAARRRARSG